MMTIQIFEKECEEQGWLFSRNINNTIVQYTYYIYLTNNYVLHYLIVNTSVNTVT